MMCFAQVQAALDAKMPEWLGRGIVPDEDIPAGLKTGEPLRYGMPRWRDMFWARATSWGHCTSVEGVPRTGRRMRWGGEDQRAGCGGMTYLSLALDKLLNYNSRMSVWMPTRQVVANTFNRHDFAFSLEPFGNGPHRHGPGI